MTKTKLINKLKELADQDEAESDPEMDHLKADDLLLGFINDPEITAAFGAVRKWYA